MDRITDSAEYFEETFKGLTLSEKQFIGVEFEECEFLDCDFSGSRFRSCKFTNCDFTRCNLSLTDFANSQLFGMTFKDCKMVGIDWTKIDWPQYYLDFELKFTRCLLNDSSFYGLNLNALHMDECKLHDVDFREGNFVESKMIQCEFDRSLFMRTNLQRVDFTDSSGCAMNVLNNQLSGATFSRYEALNLLESLGITLVD